ncbi:hypothetical protein BZM26_23885 [Paraburkholderia strydomiana]|nr:hypothetical protein BZM26_23885 [Paraburkholderia strydomiana]
MTVSVCGFADSATAAATVSASADSGAAVAAVATSERADALPCRCCCGVARLAALTVRFCRFRRW